MRDLEGIFHNCGSWGPRKMNTCTILGLYNVLLFTKGLSCSSWYLILLPTPHMETEVGSIISTVQMRKLRFPEVDFPNNQCTHCLRGIGMASLIPHWHQQSCGWISGVVRRGWRCKIIPQIAVLGEAGYFAQADSQLWFRYSPDFTYQV